MWTYSECHVGISGVGRSWVVHLLIHFLSVIPGVHEAHVGMGVIGLQLLNDLNSHQTHQLQYQMA